MDPDRFLAERAPRWKELDGLVRELSAPARRRAAPRKVLRMAHLYRGACADLALADAWQLPEGHVRWLEELVARAHGRLHASRPPGWGTIGSRLFAELPALLRSDRFLRVSAALFFGTFLVTGIVSAVRPEAAERLVGGPFLEQMEQMHASRESRGPDSSALMTGFYIQHNATIGLQCFAWGIFFGIGTLYCLVSNAVILGAVFGHLATTPAAGPFYDFVTAHAPFELTAIALSGAAGLRLGFSLLSTGGLHRLASLQKAARECVPVLGLCVVLFALAAMVEAWVSPSGLPYALKVGVAASSAVLIVGLIAWRNAGGPARDP